jgi:hypothetical protein
MPHALFGHMRAAAILVVACCSAAHAEWTGRLGLNFDSDVPIESRAMNCPSGYITGLTVRHGRDSKTDVDTYDFRLKCGGRRWGAWSGMPFTNLLEEKTIECPLQQYMTGLEVKQGRKEFGDVPRLPPRSAHRACTRSVAWLRRSGGRSAVAELDTCACGVGGALCVCLGGCVRWTRTTSSCSARASGRSTRLIPSHPIPSHLIPSHLIPSHLIPSSSHPTGTWGCNSRARSRRPPPSAPPARWPGRGARTADSSRRTTVMTTPHPRLQPGTSGLMGKRRDGTKQRDAGRTPDSQVGAETLRAQQHGACGAGPTQSRSVLSCVL